MKHLKFLTLTLLCMSLVGCQSTPSRDVTTQEVSTDSPKALTYTNLVDAPTQEQLRQTLLDVGISEIALNAFFENVNAFNKKVEEPAALQEGYNTINQLEVDYSTIAFNAPTNDDLAVAMDLNCRLTAFLLLRDTLVFDHLETTADNYLMYDLMQFDENPDYTKYKPYINGFITLFNPVAVKPSSSQREQVTALKAALDARKITFSAADKLSLVSIYLHDPYENVRFVGHTGIEVTTDNGILFIEKIGACSPYQVSKFKSEQELITYLLSRSDLKGDANENAPIITKNHKVISA